MQVRTFFLPQMHLDQQLAAAGPGHVIVFTSPNLTLNFLSDRFVCQSDNYLVLARRQ